MGVHSLTIHYYYKVHILKKKNTQNIGEGLALLQLDTIKGNKLTWPSYHSIRYTFAKANIRSGALLPST